MGFVRVLRGGLVLSILGMDLPSSCPGFGLGGIFFLEIFRFFLGLGGEVCLWYFMDFFW